MTDPLHQMTTTMAARNTRSKTPPKHLGELVSLAVDDARESIPPDWQWMEEDLDDLAVEVAKLRQFVAELDHECVKRGSMSR